MYAQKIGTFTYFTVFYHKNKYSRFCELESQRSSLESTQGFLIYRKHYSK